MANNQYNFLDYAGLSLFWNNVKSIIEENELATTTTLTNLDTRVDNVESSKADKDGTGASGTWGISITGNAATATKIGTSTVGSYTMPVYIKSGAPTAIHALPESYLSWGGTNIEGHISPIDAACCDDLGNNKLAFLPADCVTIEYTTDGGSTWIDYGAGDDQKISLVTYGNIPFYIGKGLGTMTNSNCSNYQVRITVSAVNSSGICKIYTDPQKLLINYSSQGAGGGKVKLETQTLGDYENNEDTWSTMGTYRVEGYSGWNSIPLGFAFGGFEGQSSNIAKLRLTLSITSINPGESYTNFASILGIRLIGINLWITPSIMSSRGHLYAYDAYQNADFPAAVKATKFIVAGGATPSQNPSALFLKADGSLDSNTYTKLGHTHTGTEVTLTGYSRRDSYEEIKSTDTVNQAIAKLEGALSGLEALLASI